ncbi:MAG: hypothetical protein WEA76_11480 [Acidimicrobiia bacterium]
MKTVTSPITSPITSPSITPVTTAVTTTVEAADVRNANADGGDDSAIAAALRALTSAGIGFEVLFETDSTGLAA